MLKLKKNKVCLTERKWMQGIREDCSGSCNWMSEKPLWLCKSLTVKYFIDSTILGMKWHLERGTAHVNCTG